MHRLRIVALKEEGTGWRGGGEGKSHTSY